MSRTSPKPTSANGAQHPGLVRTLVGIDARASRRGRGAGRPGRRPGRAAPAASRLRAAARSRGPGRDSGDPTTSPKPMGPPMARGHRLPARCREPGRRGPNEGPPHQVLAADPSSVISPGPSRSRCCKTTVFRMCCPSIYDKRTPLLVPRSNRWAVVTATRLNPPAVGAGA